jgi:hypothetical protein
MWMGMEILIYMSPITDSTQCEPSSDLRIRTVRGKPQVVGRYRDYYKIINGKLVEYGEPDAIIPQ